MAVVSISPIEVFDFLDPEVLYVRFDRHAVNADIGDLPGGRDDLLAYVEGCWHADGLDRYVDEEGMRYA